LAFSFIRGYNYSISMSKIVLDSNIYIDGLMGHRQGFTNALYCRIKQCNVSVYLSTNIVNEVCRVLRRNRFSGDRMLFALDELWGVATHYVEPWPLDLDTCSHSDDVWVAGAAVACQADYLVTRDIDFLAKVSIDRTRLIHPLKYYRLLEGQLVSKPSYSPPLSSHSASISPAPTV